MPLGSDEIYRMSAAGKIGEAMRRSLPRLPAGARAAVEAMLTPGTLAVIAGTLAVWAGSHFFGVGEVVDVILLGVGVLTLGFSVFEGATDLYNFATLALNARSDADLNRASEHFARAVVVLGIAAIQAVLLRGQARTVAARGRPQIQGRIAIQEPPPAGNELRLSRPTSIPSGALGDTNAYGVIRVARNQSMTEQRLTLLHELVHRYLSPRVGPLRKIRAEIRLAGYARSAFLRYMEEAMAEGYAQLMVNGFGSAIEALRFPITGGYVVVSQLVAEGQAVGTIAFGGFIFRVSIAMGKIPPNQ
jgi:hypothetical protein